MKIPFNSSPIIISATLLSLWPLAAAAKPSQALVAFRATAPANRGRHVSSKPGVGLMLGSTVLGNKEVFTLVDLNGGALKGRRCNSNPIRFRQTSQLLARKCGQNHANRRQTGQKLPLQSEMEAAGQNLAAPRGKRQVGVGAGERKRYGLAGQNERSHAGF